MKSQVLLVDMRSTEQLSHHHVKTAADDHRFAVDGRARCKTDMFTSVSKKNAAIVFALTAGKLTGDVMEPPEDHLHMVPHIQGAEP